MRTRKKMLASGIAIMASATLVACSGAGGSDFPPSQISLTVPWAAGGGSDQATRQLAAVAEENCETRFVISNKTGAAGATGHEDIVNARPDGSSVGTMTAEATILPHLGSTTAMVDDFTPIMRFASISPAFVVQADSPITSVDELVDQMGAGDTVRIGTTGAGGIWDIAAGGLEQETGVEFTERVPYDGGASIIQALLGGHIEVASLAAPEVVEQVEAGDLRVLAVASDERADILPDAPTLIEEGYEWDTSTWFGIAGPADMDPEHVSYLSDCFVDAYETDEYQEFLSNMGYNPSLMDSEEFASFIDEQNGVYAELVPTLYGE